MLLRHTLPFFLNFFERILIPFYPPTQETPLPFKLQVKPTTSSVILNVINCRFNDTVVNEWCDHHVADEIS